MKRDASTFFSYRFRMVGQVLAMFSTLLIFYYVGKLLRPKVVGPRGQYFAFVAVGIVTAGVLTSALNTWQIVRMELVAGHFDRVRSPPLGPVWGVISVAAFPVCSSTAFSGAMLGLEVLLFGVPFHVTGMGRRWAWRCSEPFAWPASGCCPRPACWRSSPQGVILSGGS